MTSQQSTAETQPRVIRVFVSSTFRDMQAERDELVKFIFPQLRKLCEQRGVGWGYVDLRWGITEKQQREGEVLPICLKEIQRCRPYFIGVLGERYGSLPDTISSELIEREPWLKEYSDHSVTELEILHGVLNDPRMAEHAFFYFRDPGYLNTLPPEQKSAFLESDLAEEIEKVGLEEAHRRTEQRKQKLVDLKERIRNSGFPVAENYPNPKEFGQTVLQDLTAVINELYPEGSQPDPLDREAAEHEIFAQSRVQLYIGRQSYFDQLDTHARSDGQPLVILGESGSGKSALLANWAMRYRTEHPDELVLMHFIGATPSSADGAAMLRRILGEFKRKFDIREEIPDHPDALRNAFPNWLNMAAARGKVVLILDALNQLDDRDGAPDLVWLPPHIPENVRMFLSTLPGRSLEEIKKRGWPILTIEPLQYNERVQLIKEYLGLSTRALDDAQENRIASAAQCQNPLFLRVLLDELQQFGTFERLGDQIDLYLKAPTIPALFELILERCEQDYERERPGLVRDAMSLLWAARRGLSEVELMELLGVDGQPLPRAHWSPLYLAMEQSFLSRGGLIGFFHDYLRQAVQNYFLQDSSLQKSAHLRLADYFEAQKGMTPRKTTEWPWQLRAAELWKQLETALTDLDLFVALDNDKSKWELAGYWLPLRQQGRDMEACYAEAYEHRVSALPGDSRNAHLAYNLGVFLIANGCFRTGKSLTEKAAASVKFSGDANYATSQSTLALLLEEQGDFKRAAKIREEVLSVYEHSFGKQDPFTATACINLARTYLLMDRLAAATPLIKRAIAIDEAIHGKEHPEVATDLSVLAECLRAAGKLGESKAVLQRALSICRKNLPARSPLVATILSNIAVILVQTGRAKEAEPLALEAVAIDRECLGNEHPNLAIRLNNLAGTQKANGRTRDALKPAQEALEILVANSVRAGVPDRHVEASAIALASLATEAGLQPPLVTWLVNKCLAPMRELK